MDPVTAGLVELGPLGLFAGFLVWQHHRLQKRADAWQASHTAEVDKVRDRYDAVIAAKDERYNELLERVEANVTVIRSWVERQER